MKPIRSFFVAASLVTTLLLATTHSAKSGEKRSRTICCQPLAVACQPIAGQSLAVAQTCCQPAAATITATASSTIDLIAYAQPANPRRLVPQPDSLEINPTLAISTCALYMYANFGSYQYYYGINCSTNSPVSMIGDRLGPLPGDCANPIGDNACVTIGASVVPTAANSRVPRSNGSFAQKGVKLARKLNAGQEPINKPNAQATKPHELKERTRIGQPIYVKFAPASGSSDFIVAELQRFSVKGLGATGQELVGTFNVGFEIDNAPAGKAVKTIDRDQISVVDDHVARLAIGNTTYEIVTASPLAK